MRTYPLPHTHFLPDSLPPSLQDTSPRDPRPDSFALGLNPSLLGSLTPAFTPSLQNSLPPVLRTHYLPPSLTTSLLNYLITHTLPESQTHLLLDSRALPHSLPESLPSRFPPTKTPSYTHSITDLLALGLAPSLPY